ncbi:uncharacterized protein LOC131010224 [Salvia miltiorrhiza]|uniref:uncharacterized protein LOC131010224 n=1 Tax=Salvia miltiorrhiza TaxID=226208 RepID=UPI0025ACC792|nr:uncharacterized protein LOC131010224 [Salvia miltiorrhiza]
MSNNHQDSATSNEMVSNKSNKPDKTRRSWSTREEEVLLAAMKELVVQGWKSDNGFRAGYLGKLEESVKKVFPGTDLKGIPHIHSRIATWKRNYNSLQLILGKTGAGFNVDGKHMIDLDIEEWDIIAKSDPNARSMRTKSWPHLEAWKEIFGKDRATGLGAEDAVDAVNEMQNGVELDNDGTQGDYYPHFEEDVHSEAADASVGQPAKMGGAARSSSRKHSSEQAFDGLCQVISDLSKGANERMEKMSSRIGYKQDLGEARKEVFNQLSNMPTLTMDDKFDAYEILAGDKKALELFMALPLDAKPQYVVRILMNKKL